MKAATGNLAQSLILVLGAAWPLATYTSLPLLGMRLTTLVALGLVVLCLTDMAATRRTGIPFDVAWPAGGLVLLSWAAMDRAGAAHATLIWLTFLGVVHFARGGALLDRGLGSVAGSGAVLALLGIVGAALALSHSWPLQEYFGDVAPLLNGLLFAPMVASTRDLLGGSVTLVVCSVAALHAWKSKNGVQRLTSAATLVAVLTVAASWVPWVRNYWTLYPVPEPVRWGLANLTSMALIGWLSARIMAKVVVQARETGSMPPVGLLVPGVLCLACIGGLPESGLGYALLGGLFTGSTLPGEGRPARWLPASVAAIPVLLTLGLNLSHVDPLNQGDPRNYEARARDDIRVGKLEQAWRRVTLVQAMDSGERRSLLWQARLALEYDRPYLAASKLVAAVESPAGFQMLPPPTDGEVDAFLVRMRDYCSSLPRPERTFAYEKALFATGHADAALALLRGKAASLPGDATIDDEDFLLNTMAGLLGCNANVLARAALPVDKWSALLLAWGADVRKGVLVRISRATAVEARFGVGEGSARIFGSEGRHTGMGTIMTAGGIVAMPPPPITKGLPPVPVRWGIVSLLGNRPDIRLFVGDASEQATTRPVTIGEDDDFRVVLFADFRGALPDTPPILVLLPQPWAGSSPAVEKGKDHP